MRNQHQVKRFPLRHGRHAHVIAAAEQSRVRAIQPASNLAQQQTIPQLATIAISSMAWHGARLHRCRRRRCRHRCRSSFRVTQFSRRTDLHSRHEITTISSSSDDSSLAYRSVDKSIDTSRRCMRVSLSEGLYKGKENQSDAGSTTQP